MPKLNYGTCFIIPIPFTYAQTYELMQIQMNDSQGLVFHGLSPPPLFT